jgi:hypothetical protein
MPRSAAHQQLVAKCSTSAGRLCPMLCVAFLPPYPTSPPACTPMHARPNVLRCASLFVPRCADFGTSHAEELAGLGEEVAQRVGATLTIPLPTLPTLATAAFDASGDALAAQAVERALLSGGGGDKGSGGGSNGGPMASGAQPPQPLHLGPLLSAGLPGIRALLCPPDDVLLTQLRATKRDILQVVAGGRGLGWEMQTCTRVYPCDKYWGVSSVTENTVASASASWPTTEKKSLTWLPVQHPIQP